MATISEAKLRISHDHTKKLATPVVTGKVTFTAAEQALMKALSGERVFKLTCELWGADDWFYGGDNKLYRYTTVYYFADSTPTSPESRTFTVTVGEGVLDEDKGTDDIYGKLILSNVLFPVPPVTGKTNQVHHNF
jgi:hypothetical protein